MIRTGGQGHELIPYLLSSRSGSPDSLASLGCHANQQPSMHQIQHHQRLCGRQSGGFEQLAAGITAGTANGLAIRLFPSTIAVAGVPKVGLALAAQNLKTDHARQPLSLPRQTSHRSSIHLPSQRLTSHTLFIHT